MFFVLISCYTGKTDEPKGQQCRSLFHAHEIATYEDIKAWPSSIQHIHFPEASNFIILIIITVHSIS